MLFGSMNRIQKYVYICYILHNANKLTLCGLYISYLECILYTFIQNLATCPIKYIQMLLGLKSQILHL